MSKSGIIKGDQAEKLYSYPTLSGSANQYLNGSGTFSTISAAAADHTHAAATTSKAGFMSTADKTAVNKIAALESSLQSANASIASLNALLMNAWTYSSDTTGAVSFSPSNGVKLITIPIAGS